MKRTFSITQRILVLAFCAASLSPNSDACPSAFLTESPTYDHTVNTLLHQVRADVLHKLRRRDPQITSVRVGVDEQMLNGPDEELLLRIYTIRKGKETMLPHTWTSYLVDGDILSVIFEIGADYRNLGLSKLFALTILNEQPQIRKFNAALSGINKDLVMQELLQVPASPAMVGESADTQSSSRNLQFVYLQQYMHLRGAQSVSLRNVRRRILNGINQTPFMKLRRFLGFNRLRKIGIEIRPNQDPIIAIFVETELGRPLPSSVTKVIIDEKYHSNSQPYEILPNGELRPGQAVWP